MSVVQMAAVFRSSRAKGNARLVLLALADVANDAGEVTAYGRSHKRLAAKANCDEGSVGRAIAKLVELGELEVLRTGDGRASSDYQLHVTEGGQSEGVQDAPPGGAERAPRDGKSRPQGVQDAPPISPSSSVPTPSVEPSPAAPGAELFQVPPDDDAIADRPLRPGEPVPTYEFPDWYREYPLHRGRGQAERAYATARRKASAQVLVAAARAYAEEQGRALRPGEFRPNTAHPATWLNGERWLDERGPANRAPESSWDDGATGALGADEL